MKIVLSAMLLVLMGMQTFSIDGSLALGLSVKNVLIYFSALLLAAHYVISRNLRVQLPGFQVAFIFVILYALLSWLTLSFAIRHPNYDVLRGAIALKADLIDQFIVLLVFFYGVQTLRDSQFVLRTFLIGVLLANLVSLLDASGVLGWNIVSLRTEVDWEYGRVQGAFGDANEYAALNAMVIPAFAAQCLMTRGYRRVVWGVAVGFGFAAIFMTASRGAMVGLLVALAAGAIMFKRHVSVGRLVAAAAGAALMLVLVAVALTDTYADLARDRFIGLTFSGDLSTASSGRSEIWVAVLERMAASPWSFFSGFGWSPSSYLDFDIAPHNEYLRWWFNLGLPGLAAFCLIFASMLGAMRAGVDSGAPEERPLLMALWVGLVALLVSIFFVGFTTLPWLYVWAYSGLACRYALSAKSLQAEVPDSVAVRAPENGVPIAGRLHYPRLGAGVRTGVHDGRRRSGQSGVVQQR